MSDLIRRQDAANLLYKMLADDYVDGYAYLEQLRTLPSAEPELKWIPVTEALPEEKGEYLVSYHPCHWNAVSEKVVVGMDTFRGKTTWAKKKYQKVIALMPLPEPWRGEE